MKHLQLIILFTFVSLLSPGQLLIDPAKLPLVNAAPSVAGVDPKNTISIEYIFSHGLKVTMIDASFRVLQFDVVYDCHSGFLPDFDIRRYQGNKIEATDKYLRQRMLTGDVMDIINTVIEKNGVRYRMKPFAFVVTK